jgi:hypothetical protein
MKYGTYILTAFETEIEKQFSTKKEMLTYLSRELFADKDMKSICVVAYEIDSDGYKKFLKTKYSVDNR